MRGSRLRQQTGQKARTVAQANKENCVNARRIGILTNGGDSPGLNAGIAAARDRIEQAGDTAVLLRNGYAGLVAAGAGDLQAALVSADSIDWRRMARWGGSVLGSSRTNFSHDTLYRQGLAGVELLALDALVIFGGDGTLTSANRLARDGLRVGAAPKTIDNDVAASDTCIGFATAVHGGADALERLADTAWTHNRTFLVEVMGRRSGYLAAAIAEAGPADAVCVPETDWTLQQLAERLEDKDGQLIIIAEGAWPQDLVEQARGSSGRTSVGGVASVVAAQLGHASVPVVAFGTGHLLRGGAPVATDRILARRLGALAAQAAQDDGGLACVRDGVAQLRDISDAAAGRRFLTDSDTAQLGSLLIGR